MRFCAAFVQVSLAVTRKNVFEYFLGKICPFITDKLNMFYAIDYAVDYAIVLCSELDKRNHILFVLTRVNACNKVKY
jgi:ATP-dependent RNA circularization protein (DNA/RNA ligase family)